MMILIGEIPLSIRGNKLLLQTKVVPRAIRPFWMSARSLFLRQLYISQVKNYKFYEKV